MEDSTFYLNDINELDLNIEKGALKIVDRYKKAVVFFTIICCKNKFNKIDFTYAQSNRVKGFEFYDAEIMALNDLKPKKQPPSDEPVNNFRIR